MPHGYVVGHVLMQGKPVIDRAIEMYNKPTKCGSRSDVSANKGYRVQSTVYNVIYDCAC